MTEKDKRIYDKLLDLEYVALYISDEDTRNAVMGLIRLLQEALLGMEGENG